MENHLWIAFACVTVVVVLCYPLFKIPEGQSMYGNTYYKWIHYFLFMLLGAIIGRKSNQGLRFRFWSDATKLLLSVVVYYVILIASMRSTHMSQCQIISLLPLLGITFYSYKICNSQQLKQLYNHTYIGWSIKFIGGLCLEIYIVQYALFTDSMNKIFPINILIMFLIIFAVAYLLRCASRIFSQTFKDGDYDWRAVFKPI